METNMVQSALPNGTTLNGGNYTIVDKIGDGGFGITYRARQNSLNRMVCIKEYFLYGRCTRDMASNKVLVQSADAELFEKYRQSFVREAETVASLKHNNIVEVLNIFHENGTSYMVMPFIEGQSLESLVTQRGALPFPEAMNYITQIADAVAYIHQRNILHRDIKPGNIMITADYRAILIDFGSAREFVNDKTQAHTSILTRGYAPPEQYSTTSRKGAYSDIYSLGATLYYAVTATPPVDVAARTAEPLPEPASLNPSLPAYANDAILKAMQLNSTYRYQSVKDFISDLVKPKQVVSLGNKNNTSSREHESKRGKVLALVLLLLLFIVAYFAIKSIFFNEPERRDTVVVQEFPKSLKGLCFEGTMYNDSTSIISFFDDENSNYDGEYCYNDSYRWIKIQSYDFTNGFLTIGAYDKNTDNYLCGLSGKLSYSKSILLFEGTVNDSDSGSFSLHKVEKTSISVSDVKERVTSCYVDLGLTSGTLWKDHNEAGFYIYKKALATFGDSLPDKDQFYELINECTWTWNNGGYDILGPNGNSIHLPADMKVDNLGNKIQVGMIGRYLSSTPAYLLNDYQYVWHLYFSNKKHYMFYRGYQDDINLVRLVMPKESKP